MSTTAPNLEHCSEPEKFLFGNVIAKVLAPSAHSYVHPQYPVDDTLGKARRLDFAILTESSRIAIELDGYTYHAEGAIPREKFDDHLSRQNELVLDGWTVIRYSWDQINANPSECRDQLRRSLISDPDLHPALRRDEIVPHEIQAEALRRLEETRGVGASRGLVALATGLGKTFLSAFDSERVGGRTLFVVHNNSILEQAREAFRKVSPERSTGLFNGYEKRPETDVVFANICSLRGGASLEEFDPKAFDYVVIDEAHHAATTNFRRVISHFRPKFLLGMTATPYRSDRRSVLDLFGGNLVYSVSQKQAVDRGFLAPFHYVALLDNVDYSNIRHNGFRYYLEDLNKALIIERRDSAIVEQYKAHVGEGKAIGFCVSIEHAERTSEYFNAHGFRTAAIHSFMSIGERQKLTQDFRDGVLDAVFVRDVFNEGVDFPDVEALLFLRPTESRLIFTQQLGRGLRLHAGKHAVKVLDFIGNYMRAGNVVSYLSDLGAEVPIGDQKPIYHYDNGTSVEFEEGVLESINILKPSVLSEGILASQFFDLVRRIRRPPTFADIHRDESLDIREVLARFGTWDRFLDRISALDPAADLSGLRPPVRDDGYSLEDYATILESDFEYVRASIQELSEKLGDLRQVILALGEPSLSDDAIGACFFDLSDAIEAVRPPSRQVTMLLSFQVAAASSTAEMLGLTSDESLEDRVAEALGDTSGRTEAYVLGRTLAAQVPMIDVHLSNSRAFDLATGERELELLTSILSGAAKISIALEHASDHAEAVSVDFFDTRESQSVLSLLSASSALNSRQRSMLKGSLDDPEGLCTVRAYARSQNTDDVTAKKDLIALEEMLLIVRSDIGHFVFEVPDDLGSRLVRVASSSALAEAGARMLRVPRKLFLSEGQRQVAESCIAEIETLNDRQIELLEYALERPGAEYTVSLHAAKSHVTESVARDDIMSLGRMGLLNPSDSRGLVFEITESIVERLQDLSSASTTKKNTQVKNADLLEGKGIPASVRSLNSRQFELIKHALSHPRAIYSIGSHRSRYSISENKARADLLLLASMSFLEKAIAGKFGYSVPGDLVERLRHFASSPHLNAAGMEQADQLLIVASALESK